MGKSSAKPVGRQVAGQPQLAFATRAPEANPAQTVIHVNFGVFTGREATQAEIDRLAERLLDRVDHVSIVSETYHEIDARSEAAVHQVRIEVGGLEETAARKELEGWIIQRAELWAHGCMAERPIGAV